MKEIQMVGNKYGRWTVLERLPRNTPKSALYYLCKCECGTVKPVYGQSLREGLSKSCGCIAKEKYKDPVNKKKLYRIYRSMKGRCENTNDKAYHNYGGRGICVSDEWKKYRSFEKWSLDHGYKEGLWLDRINNDGDYSPDNCRWTTPKVQQNNKRNTVYITINGVSKTYSEWAEIAGIKRDTFISRVKDGWSGEKLLLPKQVGYSRRHKKEKEEET